LHYLFQFPVVPEVVPGDGDDLDHGDGVDCDRRADVHVDSDGRLQHAAGPRHLPHLRVEAQGAATAEGAHGQKEAAGRGFTPLWSSLVPRRRQEERLRHGHVCLLQLGRHQTQEPATHADHLDHHRRGGGKSQGTRQRLTPPGRLCLIRNLRALTFSFPVRRVDFDI